MKINSKPITLKNGQSIILRSATSADAENMLTHLKITHTESYKNLNQSVEYWNQFSVNDEEKILADFENAAGKFMLVAISEGKIVGGLGFWGYQAEFVKRTASLGMSIQNQYCGAGLGTAMLTLTLSEAKAIGFRRVELTVRSYNEAAIKLYENLGFRRIGLLKDAAFIDGHYVDEFSYQILLD